MVAIRAMQSRVTRLGQRALSPFERKVPWQEFHDMTIDAVNKGEMDPADAEDIYFGVKAWYDNSTYWR